MKKAFVSALAAAFLLASCGPASASSETSSPSSEAEDSSSSSSSSTVDKLDAAGVLSLLANPDGLAFSGRLEIKEASQSGMGIPTYYYASGYFASGEYYNYEKGYEPIHLLENEAGNAAIPTLSPDNEVVYEEATVINSEQERVPVPFAPAYVNPFLSLEASSLVPEDGGFSISLSDDSLAERFGYAFTTMADFAVEKIAIDVEGGEITEVRFGGKDIPTGSSTIESSLSFRLVSKEEAGVPEVKPLPAIDGQERIAALLASLKKGNFTAKIENEDAVDDYDFSGKIEATEDLLLISKGTGASASTSGYYAVGDNSIAPVKVSADGNSIVGTNYPSEGTIAAQIGASFELSSAFFVPSQESPNVFVLAEEGTSYASMVDPAAVLDENLGFLTPGTFKIELTDGGCRITYDYYFEYVSVYEGRVTIEVTSIGTTLASYGTDDYVSYVPPASWTELGVEEALGKWLGGNASVLPYPSEEMGASLVETLDSDEFFGIYATPSDDVGLSRLLYNYDSALLDGGWEYSGTDIFGDDEYSYETEGQAFRLALSSNQGAMMIAVYPPSEISPLADLFRTVLCDDPNSTVSMSLVDSLYDGYGTADEALASRKSYSYEAKWRSDAASFKSSGDASHRDEIYLDNGDGCLDRYVNDGNGYKMNGSTVGTVSQSLFSWFDYESYVGGISELGDGAYKMAGESLTRLIYLVSWGELDFQYGDESLPFEDGIAVSYDAAAGTVSGSGKIVFPADASGKTRVVDVSFEIMDIGTTTVSLPS